MKLISEVGGDRPPQPPSQAHPHPINILKSPPKPAPQTQNLEFSIIHLSNDPTDHLNNLAYIKAWLLLNNKIKICTTSVLYYDLKN